MKQQEEDFLKSIEGIQRASPSPFFYQKILQKMETKQDTSYDWTIYFFRWLTQPSAVIGIALCLIAFNLIHLKNWESQSDLTSTTQEGTSHHPQDVLLESYMTEISPKETVLY